MEVDQIEKQIDWLDEERRKDKSKMTSLEERLFVVEGAYPPLSQQIKDLSSEITRLTSLMTIMDNFDNNLLQQRVETKQYFEELERQFKKSSDEAEKVRRVEIRALDSSLAELRKELEAIPEIKRSLKSRADEESRLGRLIDEVRVKIDGVRRSDEEYTRTFHILDDGRKQDSKRLVDLQGELTAVRKRIDEQRGQVELTSNSIRKVEVRINELNIIDSERRDIMASFLEKQALSQVERERIWKEWAAKFEAIEGQTANIESNLQTLDATHRAVKRVQGTIEELALKVERRIGEITEIQRLTEERFRQDWTTFKADDQKRWTNYTLTLEEQRSETQRHLEKLIERVDELEDSIQEAHDLINQSSQQTEKQLQSLLALAHEWVSTYERSVGRTK